MTRIIEAQKITKIFGQEKNQTIALNDVSIFITANEFVCVMGPSGSGKSTLLFAVSGMDMIDKGSVSINGVPLYDMDEQKLADFRRKKMGFVFQNPTMLPSLDILDNIMLPSYEDYKKDKSKLSQMALKLMKLTGIEGIENRKITEVSGGQLQRASICRAILHNPDILFGDEPTGALNSKSSEEILDIFEQLNKKGMTILLVTHDPKVAARAGRIIFMKDGALESELNFENENQHTRLDLINQKMSELGI
ncbi:MAG TPA: ABC transporter ATP-binding protein [Clostridiaceae bacterium]|nr:ABC transporter ATP-binding protein [Clostridiaceae bacterium]